MPRTITFLFRRNPERDQHDGRIAYENYEIFWPDGTPVTTNIGAFCCQGQRLLGLGRYLAGQTEKLINILVFPLANLESDITHLPGARVRRFYLERRGPQGRLHFMDGTPTAVVFELGVDEPPVLEWIGLSMLGEGQKQWLDLAAMPN
jgi:hypothetical protein